LSGRRIVTTRDERGRLDSLLAGAGADVVHVPLIAIAEPPDGGMALAAALRDLRGYHWLIVTSRHGAQRVGAAARRHPEVRLAAVGARTAAELEDVAGREITIVPSRQTAAALVDAMPTPPLGERRVMIVQADRADDVLAAGLQADGYDVTTVVGYSTRLRTPSAAERSAAIGADAVAFASGSAAVAWAEVFGDVTPPVVVAIGPTTSQVATDAGLQITHVAADHSVDGVAAVITSVLAGRP
jgi:uroporphyrinogen-III synthase